MPSNKNQHFVPQCYLRAFAADNDRKTVHVFNLDREAVIKSAASIKGQCSQDYFYGKDNPLENAVKYEEDRYGAILPDLLTRGKPLTKTSREVLAHFWLLQFARTEAASQRLVEMAEEEDGLIAHQSVSFKLSLKEAIANSLSTCLQCLDAIADLNIVLAYNKTTIPFVTSDDPALLVNRWLVRNSAAVGAGCGPTTAGVVCLLPIAPTVCCIFYDAHVYSVPHQNNWIDLSNAADIDAINDLQYMSAVANIYFSNSNHCNTLVALHQRNARHRPTVRHRIHYSIEVESTRDSRIFKRVDKNAIPPHTQALIHTETLRLEPKKWPTFLRWRRNGYVYTNASGSDPVRHAAFYGEGARPMIKRSTGR